MAFEKFYRENKNAVDLRNIKVDNGTYEINIPTPKNWKCKKRGCFIDYEHTHNSFIK